MLSFKRTQLRNALLKKRNLRKRNQPVSKSETILISDYLTPNRICFFENVSHHPFILENLIKLLPDQDPAALFAAVQEREQMGSTAVTSDIAFPHARIQGLNKIAGAIGICPAGVRTPCGATVRLFFLFVSPVEDTKNHLRFLASASSLFLGENFLENLAGLKTPEAVFEKIRECELNSKRKNAEAARSNA